MPLGCALRSCDRFIVPAYCLLRRHGDSDLGEDMPVDGRKELVIRLCGKESANRIDHYKWTRRWGHLRVTRNV